MSREEIRRIHRAGLLHDVGKARVPSEILSKAGPLTPDEFEHVKTHPQCGADMLRNIPGAADLLPGVLHHHERFDGSGYPAGLAGEQIPLIARVLCLADSLDAMTSVRPYRRPLELADALREITACAGSQFDPALSRTLLSIPRAKLRTLLAA